MPTWDNPLITIMSEKCRMCYACVRECPAKAIQVVDGQAQVIQPRCIGCGNCLRVCSQNAKQVRDDTAKAFTLLRSTGPLKSEASSPECAGYEREKDAGSADSSAIGATENTLSHRPVRSGDRGFGLQRPTQARVVAMVAPSFPAEFADMAPGTLVAMIRALGFESVHEITLGADLVAHAYRTLLEDNPEGRYITTPCPAAVSYVRKYHPRILPYLAPIVSPMVAMARVLRHDFSDDINVVFMGPCVAKKRASVDTTHAEVDAVLTFAELRDMFRRRGIKPQMFRDDDQFDPPYGGLGALFPIAGGLLQAAGLTEDLLAGELVVAEGRGEFVEALSEFDVSQADTRLLDVLACMGCFAGPGMTGDATMLQRRARVSAYARSRLSGMSDLEKAEVTDAVRKYAELDLTREYVADAQTLGENATFDELEDILHRMGKFEAEDLLNCGACGYDTCLDHAHAVYAGLADSDMCLPHTIEQLRGAYKELEVSHKSLEEAKEALERSGKLASMGQLAAGIAHEVNNPLGTLLLHANMLLEECEEEGELKTDLETIVDQANRCKRIISGLLNFARQSRVVRQPTDLSGLVDKVIRTSPTAENVTVSVQDSLTDRMAEIDGDQIVQVLTNLFTNAQQAMPDGGTVTIALDDDPETVTIHVSDTGVGVPKEHMAQLFDPFFTTKQVGMGTGLGLAVTHGIVKMHRGQITVQSNGDPAAGPTGTTFVIELPRHEVGTPTPAGMIGITA